MSEQPAISVGIPLYNRRDLITATIESVLAQTSAPHEILVVDDGSTDGSGEVVSYLAQQHAGIRQVRQSNAGECAARNRLLMEFTGDWLAFIDSDDLWLPTKLANAAALIADDPTLEFIHSNRLHVWPDGHMDDGRVGDESSHMNQPAYLMADWRTKISTLVIKRSLIERMKPDWFGSLRICGDYEFMWRAMAIARGVGYVSQPDTKILVTDDGMSRGADPVVHIRSDISAMRSAIRWLEGRQLNDYVAILKQRQYREYQQLMVLGWQNEWRSALAAFRDCVGDLKATRATRALLSSLVAFRSQHR